MAAIYRASNPKTSTNPANVDNPLDGGPALPATEVGRVNGQPLRICWARWWLIPSTSPVSRTLSPIAFRHCAATSAA